jgi:Dolichyl-phosphate-mannose-protein mannosyltransferase
MTESQAVTPRSALETGSGAVPFRMTAALVFLLALILRVRFFLSFATLSVNRDEVGLALDLHGATFRELLKPILRDQAAPPGFLVLAKLCTDLVGTSERGLRLLSLLSSILALPLFYILMRRILSPAGAVVGLGLVAMSEVLIYQGTVFKQYSFDVLATLILLLAALPGSRQTSGHGPYVRFGIIGAIAVWFSFPSVFVIGGIGLTWIFSESRRGRAQTAVRWGAASGVCALSFGVAYLTIYRHYAANEFLQHYWGDYWGDSFAPFPPRSIDDFKWYLTRFGGMFELVGVTDVGLAGVMLLFGAYCLWRSLDQRFYVSLLLAPIGVALIASMLRKYPFGERTMLYVVPHLVPLIAAGVAAAATGSRGKALAAIIVGTLLIRPAYLDAKYFINPHARALIDVKPTLAYIHDHWNPGDVLFVQWDGVMFYDYYVDKLNYMDMKNYKIIRAEQPPHQMTATLEERLATYTENLKRLGNERRVWFLVGIKNPFEATIMIELLEARGKHLDAYQGLGSQAHYFELGTARKAGQNTGG